MRSILYSSGSGRRNRLPYQVLGRCGVRPAQDQVEAIAERKLFFREVYIEAGEHAMFRPVGDRLENRIVGQHRVAFEIHLGHESGYERRPEERKVDVRGAPGIRVIVPRVSPRFYCQKAVFSVFVRQYSPVPVEVGVEGSTEIVETMGVTAGRIRLPDLDQDRKSTRL